MDVNHRQIARSVANQNGFPGHMGAPLTLIHELESSISNSSDERRSAMLRHLTDLFLVGSDQYSDAEIDLIDDVFVRLVATIENSSRALLAIRLGPVTSAPLKILRLLACDDAIEVALSCSNPGRKARYRHADRMCAHQESGTPARHLASQDPARSANRRSGRARRSAGRIEHCEKRRRQFSGKGFDTLIERSCGDDALTSCVGARSDLPPKLLDQLLAAASEKVRTKLMAEREYAKADIERAVDDVAGQIQAGAAGSL